MELVFLHGFCESSEIWSEIVPGLASKWKVHTPDLPGFGGAELTSESSLADVAKLLLSTLTTQNELFLVGHSLGGYLALEILKANPKLVKGICLFHSTAKADTAEKKANRDKTIQHLARYGKEEFLHQFVPNLFSDSIYRSRPDLVSRMEHIVKNASNRSIINYTKWMRDRPENFSTLQKCKVPVSYIAGTEDKFLPVESLIEEAGEIPTSSFYQVKKSGHLAMMEAPAECILYLEEEISMKKRGAF